MKYSCLVVDDEPLARKLMVAHISKLESLTLMGECADAIEAGNLLRTRKPDLIFLDIQMPEITGLQFVNTLKYPPAVIFTTAFRDFAPEAFDLGVVDYLLKPISFERFMKAVNKFFDKLAGESINLVSNVQESFIYLKADRKVHKLSLDDIIYIESLDDYVKVHLPIEVLVTRENISTLEERLPPARFVRIHRSYIVNANRITAIAAEGVEIAKVRLPFGRTYKKSALAALSIQGN